MGMDSVELVMSFEEKFAITIPDEEAEKMVMPRHVIDYIYRQVQRSDSKVCLTQRAFHRLRRAAQTELRAERRDVRPDTLWEALVPREGRRDAWSRLQQSVAVASWPGLVRSEATGFSIATASLAATLLTIFALVPLQPISSFAVGGTTAFVLLMLTEPLRLHFAADCRTVGQAAEFLVATSPDALKPNEGWSREQVRAVVRAIIIDQLNVSPTFSDDASFVDDLGLS